VAREGATSLPVAATGTSSGGTKAARGGPSSSAAEPPTNKTRAEESGTDRYRVFISYSHGDTALAQRIAERLVAEGMMPMWDKTFSYGHGFPVHRTRARISADHH
jgi:hypothetical protein